MVFIGKSRRDQTHDGKAGPWDLKARKARRRMEGWRHMGFLMG